MINTVIGIDPDVVKSGYAKCNEDGLTLQTLSLWEVFLLLKEYQLDRSVLVIIEAGWLIKNKSYHGGGKGSAYDVGRNSEIGRQIEKYCIEHNIQYQLVNPVGYSSYTHERFCLITGYKGKKTNSETRVAGLYANNFYKKMVMKNQENK